MGIREASYAMGATKWQTIYKVVLPAAKLGIVDAIVLGMGRAIGETMAVLMVVGNAPVIPDSISSPISTLTSQIALDMSYSSACIARLCLAWAWSCLSSQLHWWVSFA
mgnify:FL=1